MTQWTDFQVKLSQLQEKNQKISFWWREDDVSEDCEHLEQVLAVLAISNVRPLCGAIPKLLTRQMAELVRSHPECIVCQHGWNHMNNYSDDYKCEFDTIDDFAKLVTGRDFLQNEFHEQFLPIYIPPWNNISKELKTFLLQNGYAGISSYNYDPARKRPLNCDVDLINWKQSESFGGADFVAEQILRCFDNSDFNIGIVNHHRTIGTKGLEFLKDLLLELQKYPNISWEQPSVV